MVRPHLHYLWYVLRHKWHVYRAGRALGVGWWQLCIHDWTKFLPVEWGAYVRQFYNPDGSRRAVRDASGAYDPNMQSDAFKRAWLHHQRQPHHWQSWVSIGDGGSLVALPMLQRFVREMVADWIGAGLAQGKPDAAGWYKANQSRMVLHEDTRAEVVYWLQVAGQRGIIPQG